MKKSPIVVCPYMFRVCGRDDDQSKIAGTFIKNYLKAKTIYIVDDKTTYSQGLAENVKKQCNQLGIKVLSHDHVNQGDKDFSAVLTKIKRANPDAFYMSLQNSASGSLMAIQAKRFGLKAKIIAQDAVYHPQFITIAKEAAEGAFLTFGYTDKNTPSYKKSSKPMKPNMENPAPIRAMLMMRPYVLLTAIKNAKSTKPAKIKAEIMKLDIQGASKKIKFKANGDSGSDYIIYKVDQGEFKNYWNPVTRKLF